MRLIHEGNRFNADGRTWVKACDCRGPAKMNCIDLEIEQRGELFALRAALVSTPTCTVCGANWTLESEVVAPSNFVSAPPRIVP